MKGLSSMWDNIVQALKAPDTWTLIFGFFGTFAAAALTYLIKKLNWRFVFSFKPARPAIGPDDISKLIDAKLKESVQFKDYETLKNDHFQLLALFKVSESQWKEKIMELEAENALLKTEKQQGQGQQTTSERQN